MNVIESFHSRRDTVVAIVSALKVLAKAFRSAAFLPPARTIPATKGLAACCLPSATRVRLPWQLQQGGDLAREMGLSQTQSSTLIGLEWPMAEEKACPWLGSSLDVMPGQGSNLVETQRAEHGCWLSYARKSIWSGNIMSTTPSPSLSMPSSLFAASCFPAYMFFQRFSMALLCFSYAFDIVLACVAGLDPRQASNTCSVPKYKPLIELFAKQYPKPAVNSFCSSVVGKNGHPKTTTTVTQTTKVSYTIVDTYTFTVSPVAIRTVGRLTSMISDNVSIDELFLWECVRHS